MHCTVRPMKPGDIPRVVAIDRLSFPTPWPPRAFYYELEQPRSHYWVLLRPPADDLVPEASRGCNWLRRFLGFDERSRVVGYVGYRIHQGGAHITTIALHPDWRGRGLGELLLLIALKEMLREGVERVTLEMRPSNRVAYRLYTKYGFRMLKTQQAYYRDGEDAWLMAAHVGGDDYRAAISQRRREIEGRLREQQIAVDRQNGQGDTDNL